jgi:hypothetical protein
VSIIKGTTKQKNKTKRREFAKKKKEGERERERDDDDGFLPTIFFKGVGEVSKKTKKSRNNTTNEYCAPLF